MKFAFTHPMHSHPYNPELVTGAGIATVAAAAEAAGFHGFGFTDHPAPSQRWLESGGHDALDPFVAMGFAAARTTTLRLIPNIVVLPYRNPFVVAKSGATLDMLSGGRFTLAVGVGYLKREFTALGVEFDERAALFEEALEVIRAIWTTDDLSYEGRHFSARGITSHPRPVSSPHPPIWIGGNTGRALRRAAEHGNGWIPMPAPRKFAKFVRSAPLESLDDLRAKIDTLRELTAAAARDDTLDVVFSPMGVAPYGSSRFDAAAYIDGLGELAEMGVTYSGISFAHPGSGGLESRARFLELAEGFARDVMAAS